MIKGDTSTKERLSMWKAEWAEFQNDQLGCNTETISRDDDNDWIAVGQIRVFDHLDTQLKILVVKQDEDCADCYWVVPLSPLSVPIGPMEQSIMENPELAPDEELVLQSWNVRKPVHRKVLERAASLGPSWMTFEEPTDPVSTAVWGCVANAVVGKPLPEIGTIRDTGVDCACARAAYIDYQEFFTKLVDDCFGEKAMMLAQG